MLTHGQTPWYQVPVRQASVLPQTSFRPNVAIDTLSLAVRLPLLGRARDLHPLDYTHVGRTTANPCNSESYTDLVSDCYCLLSLN